jgi:hypothetical protein
MSVHLTWSLIHSKRKCLNFKIRIIKFVSALPAGTYFPLVSLLWISALKECASFGFRYNIHLGQPAADTVAVPLNRQQPVPIRMRSVGEPTGFAIWYSLFGAFELRSR